MFVHYKTTKIISTVRNSNVFSTKNEKKSNNYIFSQFSAIFVEKSLFFPKNIIIIGTYLIWLLRNLDTSVSKLFLMLYYCDKCKKYDFPYFQRFLIKIQLFVPKIR